MAKAQLSIESPSATTRVAFGDNCATSVAHRRLAKAQLTIEALVVFAAFLAVLSVLISAERSVAADAAGSASSISAQAEADAEAVELNLLAGDGGPLTSFNFIHSYKCTFSAARDSVSCREGNATRKAGMVSGTDSWRYYGFYNSLPV